MEIDENKEVLKKSRMDVEGENEKQTIRPIFECETGLHGQPGETK